MQGARPAEIRALKDMAKELTQEQRDKRQQYYQANKERIKVASALRYQAKKEEIKAQVATYYRANLEKRRRDAAEYQQRVRKPFYARLRAEVLAAYGNACACCGEIEPLFLQVDHINNDGHLQRKNAGRHWDWSAFMRWLKAEGFPKDNYQLLCANCNWGKRANGGVCPHRKK